jgi:hypothetical protein
LGISNWSGSNGNLLEYSVIATSGTLVISGKTAEGQSVSLQALECGMYIIFISDGMSVYSKKLSAKIKRSIRCL